ncbi:MAG TPA: 2-amino-4-hydroxy-6-hydroxymethyldihydropteridine diphosphokinase [Candidatus Koribacter sp.]|jgi:2-amino-4-hydroxy-6-hydroxymethyldihydropteridine diphosphokinase
MAIVEHTAYLSLGSNVGDRAANLREAIARLRAAGKVKRVSSLYETEPVEFTEQAWFLNCAVELRTEMGPADLLHALLGIEKSMGRMRNQPKGPRNIDIDLLLYDDETVNTPELTLPHPSMHERGFVLVPLAEIAPNVVHPTLRKTAWELLNTLREDAAVRSWNVPKE